MIQNFCGSCGKSLQNATNFCTHCGEPIKNNKNTSKEIVKKSAKKDEKLFEMKFDHGGKKVSIFEKWIIGERITEIMNSNDLSSKYGENLLWSAEEKQGFFKKPINYYFTNYRFFSLNMNTEEGIQLPIKHIDIVIMNSHRVSRRTGIGGFTSLTKGMGIGGMQSSGKSATVGDINVIFQGEIYSVISDVLDPNGLKSLVTQIGKKFDSNLENVKLS